ncbi:LANO_0F11122g1_1 [Lachancea nothofagi CBS 11611]|uniref:LANO_0F11122g1_1 n=1 Tax=Lachancea nothofagi CBS 11611 TaxID=1266666 RepID=A0A1G4KAQ1_9SACH|nr:LANO_0F11122g1_1 [Lachancea nothofagi CBS 11611]
MTSPRSSPHFLRSNSSNDEILTRSRHNTVLSTSFVSSRRADEQPASPLTPQNTRRTRSGTVKSISNIKHDIHHVQQDLARLRKSKEDTEKRRESATNDIYPGNYSQEHLQRHSLALQSNDQLRKLDQQIKKSGELLTTLRKRLDSTSSAVAEEVRSSMNSQAPFLNEDSRKQSESALTNDSVTEEEEPISPSPSNRENFSLEGFGDIQDEDEEAMTRMSSSRDAKAGKEHATWLVSDYLQSLQDKNSDKEFILSKANDLVSLLKQNPSIKFDLVLPAFSNTIQQLLLSDDEVTVSAAYRICRYLITGPEFIQELRKLLLEPFLILSLAKANSSNIERLQAFELIRSFLKYDSGISLGITQAVISIVEKNDDKLRELAIETLLELCYLKPGLVRRCKGLSVLESFIAENPSSSLSPLILESILDLLNYSDTRRYIIDCFSVSVPLTALADTQIKANFSTEKLQSSIHLICNCLKNYNGLILFCHDDFKVFRELLAFLQSPLLSKYVIDLFLDVLRIKPLPYSDRKKSSQVFKMIPSQFQAETMPVNQYIGLLASILFELHFVDHLVPLLSQTLNAKKDHNLAAKARYLITEYCNISVNLAGLRPGAADSLLFPNDTKLETVFTQIFQFEKVTIRLNKNRNTIGMNELGPKHDILEFSENSKHKALINDVDEARFKKMVYDTKVLQTKDFAFWNWGILSDLIEGPLLNPKRIDDLAKTTKFFRRLLVFYRPMRYRFSMILQSSRIATRCVQVGCQLFKTLTSTAEGMRVLNDDTKLVPQIASLLFKAMEGRLAGNVFSEENLGKTVCPGYFKILGTFTQTIRGCKVLEKWNVFTVIYKMFQQTSTLTSSYLRFILPELSFVYSLHARTILGKALVHPSEKVRVEATNLLGAKLQNLVFEAKSGPNFDDFEKFLLELLVRQLYDLSTVVVASADKIFYNYCALQDWPPSVDTPRHHLLNQLVFIRSPILLEFLRTPAGFKQLSDIGFLGTEREKWLQTKNKEYVFRVEAFIENEMSRPLSALNIPVSKRKLPMHFCNSLASTEEGVDLISQKGDFVEIINVIKKYRHNGYPEVTVEEHLELKAALWCCGYIGSTVPGINLLDTYSIGSDIVNICFLTPSTSVKFTAFYVLGLIAKTSEGCEILDELEWNCSFNVQGVPLGLTYPKKLQQLLIYPELREGHGSLYGLEQNQRRSEGTPEYETPNMDLDVLLQNKAKLENTMDDEQEEFQAEVDRQARNLEMFKLQTNPTSTDEVADKLMRVAGKLNNHILSSAAVKEISEMISFYGPARFETAEIFLRILALMEQYRFKPQARKFLCESLLNKRTLEMMIKKDKKNSEGRRHWLFSVCNINSIELRPARATKSSGSQVLVQQGGILIECVRLLKKFWNFDVFGSLVIKLFDQTQVLF